MNYKVLRILIFSTALSLLGILVTQFFWLKKTYKLAEKQFKHRTDKMLNDVVDELKTYADTSLIIQEKSEYEVSLFDVVDTVLLHELVQKYTKYHMLNSTYSYGLVSSSSGELIYSKHNFTLYLDQFSNKVCLSCLWKKEYIHLSIFFPEKEKHILGKQVLWIILSTLFILIIISAFSFMVWSIYRQKKISEIKNDFVNNMTHELKTPLSTISVASEVLMKTAGYSDNKRLNKYSRVIYEENQRMKKLVDRVLNIATLERNMVAIEKEKIKIHDTIYKMVESFCFEACNKDVDVKYNLNAKNDVVYADKLHLRNILNNLVDNAVKYSTGQPSLTVKTENIDGFFKLSIADKGKGIPKDSVKKVFDKFYRVPSGNIHDVKGFGLGLFYVKSMIEAHDGKIDIQSTLNKGTCVTVCFPQ